MINNLIKPRFDQKGSKHYDFVYQLIGKYGFLTDNYLGAQQLIYKDASNEHESTTSNSSISNESYHLYFTIKNYEFLNGKLAQRLMQAHQGFYNLVQIKHMGRFQTDFHQLHEQNPYNFKQFTQITNDDHADLVVPKKPTMNVSRTVKDSVTASSFSEITTTLFNGNELNIHTIQSQLTANHLYKRSVGNFIYKAMSSMHDGSINLSYRLLWKNASFQKKFHSYHNNMPSFNLENGSQFYSKDNRSYRNKIEMFTKWPNDLSENTGISSLFSSVQWSQLFNYQLIDRQQKMALQTFYSMQFDTEKDSSFVGSLINRIYNSNRSNYSNSNDSSQRRIYSFFNTNLKIDRQADQHNVNHVNNSRSSELFLDLLQDKSLRKDITNVEMKHEVFANSLREITNIRKQNYINNQSILKISPEIKAKFYSRMLKQIHEKLLNLFHLSMSYRLEPLDLLFQNGYFNQQQLSFVNARNNYFKLHSAGNKTDFIGNLSSRNILNHSIQNNSSGSILNFRMTKMFNANVVDQANNESSFIGQLINIKFEINKAINKNKKNNSKLIRLRQLAVYIDNEIMKLKRYGHYFNQTHNEDFVTRLNLHQITQKLSFAVVDQANNENSYAGQLINIKFEINKAINKNKKSSSKRMTLRKLAFHFDNEIMKVMNNDNQSNQTHSKEFVTKLNANIVDLENNESSFIKQLGSINLTINQVSIKNNKNKKTNIKRFELPNQIVHINNENMKLTKYDHHFNQSFQQNIRNTFDKPALQSIHDFQIINRNKVTSVVMDFIEVKNYHRLFSNNHKVNNDIQPKMYSHHLKRNTIFHILKDSIAAFHNSSNFSSQVSIMDTSINNQRRTTNLFHSESRLSILNDRSSKQPDWQQVFQPNRMITLNKLINFEMLKQTVLTEGESFDITIQRLMEYYTTNLQLKMKNMLNSLNTQKNVLLELHNENWLNHKTNDTTLMPLFNRSDLKLSTINRFDEKYLIQRRIERFNLSNSFNQTFIDKSNNENKHRLSINDSVKVKIEHLSEAGKSKFSNQLTQNMNRSTYSEPIRMDYYKPAKANSEKNDKKSVAKQTIHARLVKNKQDEERIANYVDQNLPQIVDRVYKQIERRFKLERKLRGY